MGNALPKLTIADQVLVNAMAVIAAGGTIDNGHLELAISKAREVLPRVSRGHPWIEPIAEQADRMRGFKSIEGLAARREEWNSIRFCAASALARFFFWRLAEAIHALEGVDRQSVEKLHAR